MRIAKVEPIVTARALRGPFDYLIPDGFGEVAVGTRLRVPFAGRQLDGVVTAIAGESDLPAERLSVPLRAIEPSVPEELVELGLRVAGAYCSTPARGMALVVPPGGARGTRAKLVFEASISESGSAAIEGGERLSDAQRAVLLRLSQGAATPAELGVPLASLRRLEARGLVMLVQRRLGRRPADHGYDPGLLRPELTGPQQEVLGAVVAAIDRDEAGSEGDREFLLHGVTGSGKTEIYLGAAERALAKGRGVLVLVPEIGLTPQAVARFSARLGDTVAVIHSGLSEGERYDEWCRLEAREARVCVGPRSAVFAPVRDLGLVIVDEEHETAYRNDGDPGYDAREVARWRAAMAGAVLLAGSATPRPESTRRLRTLRLDTRPDGSRLPQVDLLDMKGVRGALHPRSVEALGEVRRSGGKAIVLLNRRGWSNFISCGSCGHVWSCPSCDVTLVLHRAEGSISCHHCGHREAVPSSCSECGSASVARHGVGTERLESEIHAAVGGEGFEVIRLDADSAARKGAAAEMLKRFQSVESAVLIGTQMVAKGHDFPDVTLGIVVDADSTLRFPDFRAEERTFQLVTQLAGRAGRGSKPGRVLVQTTTPEARVLELASRHDADAFLAEELERREALGYPPAAALVRIQVAAEADEDAEALADTLAGHLAGPGITVLGPAELFRLRNRCRRQIVARSSDREALVGAVDAAVAAAAATPEGRRASIGTEVDAG